MKSSARPLAALMALVILASSLGGLASAARAQQPTINNLDNLNRSFTPSGPSGFLPSTIVPDTKSPTSPPPSTDTKTDTVAQKKPTSSAAPASTPADQVYGSVMVQIMGLFAMLLGVAVVTLDNAVYYTVVDMGKYLKNLSAIGVSWRILRDIGNVVLIFGFLVIGISVILDLNIYGYGTKMLPTLLIAAVFLNFSLFISEAVIDAGNLFATQFYTQINGGDPPAPVSYANVQGTGISNRIMDQLGLAGIYGDALAVNTDPQHSLLGAGTPWYVGFLGILLFLVAAFVIFSLAFILIVRFVILVFLIIVAPIGFAGLAVPKLEKSARDWWGQLFEQTITAPILLLMLYVALAVITDANFLTGFAAPGAKAQWTGFLSGNVDGFAGLLLSFLVAMGLLLTVTVLAKRLGAFGGAWATRLGGFASFGVTALAGSATFGGIGNIFGGKRMQGFATPREGEKGMRRYMRYALRPLVMGGKGLRAGTYDVRNLGGSRVLGALGIDAGKSVTLTGKKLAEQQYGIKPVREYLKEANREYEAAGRERDFRVAQRELARLEYEMGNGMITPEKYQEEKAQHEKVITSTLSKMSTKQLEELGGIKNGVDALVQNLSPQQFEAILKSDKLGEIEKGRIKASRYRPLASAVADGRAPDIKKTLNALSKGELEALPSELLSSPLVLEQLSDKQRDTLTDSKERTAAEKDLVRGASRVGSAEKLFKDAEATAIAAGVAAPAAQLAAARSVAGSTEFGKLTAAQVSKLDKDILLQQPVAEQLTTQALIELQEQKKLTPQEMRTIGDAIRSSSIANAKTKEYVSTGPGALIWA